MRFTLTIGICPKVSNSCFGTETRAVWLARDRLPKIAVYAHSGARKAKALGALKRPWLSRPQAPGRHLRAGPLAGDTLAGTRAKQ